MSLTAGIKALHCNDNFHHKVYVTFKVANVWTFLPFTLITSSRKAFNLVKKNIQGPTPVLERIVRVQVDRRFCSPSSVSSNHDIAIFSLTMVMIPNTIAP